MRLVSKVVKLLQGRIPAPVDPLRVLNVFVTVLSESRYGAPPTREPQN